MFFFHLWAPRAMPIKSSYCKVAAPFISRSLVRKESVNRLIWTQQTIKLSNVNLFVLGSNLAKRFCTNVGEKRYPICWKAVNEKDFFYLKRCKIFFPPTTYKFSNSDSACFLLIKILFMLKLWYAELFKVYMQLFYVKVFFKKNIYCSLS